ncbi:hypothetical protein ACFL3F_00275 [Planctomycetota bacterium]
MKVLMVNGQNYRLPGSLNAFQQELYIHLINWKWKHITKTPGSYRGLDYDAILPEKYADQFLMLYPGIVDTLRSHRQAYPFRIHRHFNHMASSQVANINLFLPVLRHSHANEILGAIRSDFVRLATDQLDNGYRIEFWDEPFGKLGDKNEASGTDSDIAIAYYNHRDELCLWLIEHKLTENEFTTCGGFRSKGRKAKHDCTRRFSEILGNKSFCYYHDVRKYHYWDITEANQGFFANYARHAQCPFQGGVNQLWRNQLLAMAVEQDERQPYKQVSFSVVRHPGNHGLDASLRAYKDLIAQNPKFSVFTSADIISAASKVRDRNIDEWVAWYCDLYSLPLPGR